MSGAVLLQKLAVSQLASNSLFTWNPNILQHLHKSRSLDPILSRMNPLHTVTHCFLKIHLISILLYATAT